MGEGAWDLENAGVIGCCFSEPEISFSFSLNYCPRCDYTLAIAVVCLVVVVVNVAVVVQVYCFPRLNPAIVGLHAYRTRDPTRPSHLDIESSIIHPISIC